jgi:DNA-binding transcriptional ArsR family regulator
MQPTDLNRIFQALADPTRRAILERLTSGSVSMSKLAQPFDMSLPSFSQHLDVLESCGLVESSKTGRVRTYQLVPQPLQIAEEWMVKQRAIWEARLEQLDDYLLTLKESTND